MRSALTKGSRGAGPNDPDNSVPARGYAVRGAVPAVGAGNTGSVQ
ncbi:hypothetical protein FTUN_7406 [Frigoriglobus tundricola]|uniref:Uncharacterized protein n=1 Tax=Frigoriglobus tundricola TaxID=2774151 RepID=A0A6M5Z2N3_9BACT|nr:hypothetical protein FTUN_7406 [Frigoriglobus tundricola]